MRPRHIRAASHLKPLLDQWKLAWPKVRANGQTTIGGHDILIGSEAGCDDVLTPVAGATQMRRPLVQHHHKPCYQLAGGVNRFSIDVCAPSLHDRACGRPQARGLPGIRSVVGAIARMDQRGDDSLEMLLSACVTPLEGSREQRVEVSVPIGIALQRTEAAVERRLIREVRYREHSAEPDHPVRGVVPHGRSTITRPDPQDAGLPHLPDRNAPIDACLIGKLVEERSQDLIPLAERSNVASRAVQHAKIIERSLPHREQPHRRQIGARDRPAKPEPARRRTTESLGALADARGRWGWPVWSR